MTNFKLPDFTLPEPLARLGGKLPQLPPTLALVIGLNLALDRLIPRAPLTGLAGRRFCLRVKDAGLTLRFGYDGRRFHPVFSPAAPDLTITARARDFYALLVREEDPDTLFFNRRLLMEGDTDLGLLVKNTLDGIDLGGIMARLDIARLMPANVVHHLRLRLRAPRGI